MITPEASLGHFALQIADAAPADAEQRRLALDGQFMFPVDHFFAPGNSPALPSAPDKKIILQCQLADLGMKLLQIDGLGFFFRRIAKDPGRPFQELVFPLLDLVGMNIELLRKPGEGLFTADGSESHLRIEGRAVIPAGSSGHGRLLCSAK